MMFLIFPPTQSKAQKLETLSCFNENFELKLLTQTF